MSLLRKIGGVFVEMEDNPKPKKAPKQTGGDTEYVGSEIPSISVGAPTPTAPIIIDNQQTAEFRQHFSKILEDENKRNFPGSDYYEFQIMKNAMSSIPQENLRYQAAFAGWAATGNLTKQQLIDTAGKYLSIVEREIKEFELAYRQQYDNSVLKNEQLIASKTEEVQKLAEKINALNAEIQSLKKENIDNVAHLSSKRDAFISAGTQQRDEINAEISKINQYIA